MLKIVNRWYSNLYYRLLIVIWDKFSNNQHWETIKFVYNVMMLKKQWYDKIDNMYNSNRVNINQVIDFNISQVRRDLKNLDHEMRMRRHANLSSRHVSSSSKINFNTKTLYRITFIIQRKVVKTNGIILNKIEEVNKRLLFVKICSNDTVLNIPIPKSSIKKLRENLTLSMYKYLNNNQVTFKNYKHLEEGKDRIFLEIDGVEELKKAEKVLNRFFKSKTEKKTKYSKRKFGKEEVVLNVQDTWVADMTMIEIEYLINKLNRLNHDMSSQVLTFEDLTSL